MPVAHQSSCITQRTRFPELHSLFRPPSDINPWLIQFMTTTSASFTHLWRHMALPKRPVDTFQRSARLNPFSKKISPRSATLAADDTTGFTCPYPRLVAVFMSHEHPGVFPPASERLHQPLGDNGGPPQLIISAQKQNLHARKVTYLSPQSLECRPSLYSLTKKHLLTGKMIHCINRNGGRCSTRTT